MIDLAILEKLDACDKAQRLANLEEILKTTQFPPMVPQYINNHIHTTYSFSPYSPTAAVYAARMEGLCTAGIIDHDSIAGAREFLEAARLVEIPVTVGMECRASMDGTRLQGRRTNNPDQVGVSYMTIQSVPHDKIEALNQWFAPYRAARDRRNRQMIDKINALLGEDLDYDRDVLPLSMHHEGGGVTERHLMYALAKKMVARAGKGQPMVDYVGSIGLTLSEKQKAQMLDTTYPFYEYDLLGLLKSAFVPKFTSTPPTSAPTSPSWWRCAGRWTPISAMPTWATWVTASPATRRPRNLRTTTWRTCLNASKRWASRLSPICPPAILRHS